MSVCMYVLLCKGAIFFHNLDLVYVRFGDLAIPRRFFFSCQATVNHRIKHCYYTLRQFDIGSEY